MKVLQVALVMAMAICVAGSAVAATNAIPYRNSFEIAGSDIGGHPTGYTNGESIVNESLGWYAPDTANGTIVTQPLDYLGALPIPTAFHEQVLEVTDSVTNMIQGGGGSKIWIDCLLKPTRVDAGEEPEGLTDAKSMLYFNSNGYPVVWGGYQNDLSSNVWHTSTSAQVSSGQWARVTLELNLIPLGLGAREYFQVYIDTEPLQFPNGTTIAGGSTTNGPWLRTVEESASNENLKSVTLSGTGQMDDFQVVLETPLTATTYTITASVDNASAAAYSTPFSGTYSVLSVSESNTVDFAFSANGGYAITDVHVDYSGFTGWLGATNAYTMTNIVSDGSITVYAEASAPSETSAGTPHDYYDTILGSGTSGWTDDDYENADTNDLDVDGMLGWQEYSTGTDASDSNSYFRVIGITYAGDSNKVSFFGTTAYGAPANWSMYRSVDLTGTWDLISTNDIPVSDGTNNWWDMDAPGTAPVFYQPSSHIE